MPSKYLPTPNDPETLRREDEAKDRYWQAQAETASASDPAFGQWKKRHNRKYTVLTALTWLMLATLAWNFYDSSKPEPKLLLAPFLLAASVWGSGRWKFNRRCRQIALEHWDRLRAEEKKQKPNPSPVTMPPKRPER